MIRCRGHLWGMLAAASVVAALSAGCTSNGPVPGPSTPATHSPTGARAPSASATASPAALLPAPGVVPRTVLDGLKSPWSIVRLPSGSVLIDDRDTGRIIERVPNGTSTRSVGTVPGVVHSGEGGLLGLAVQPGAHPDHLFAYLTTASDNRVVRMPLTGEAGSYGIGAPQPLVTGIPKGIFHNGGRLAFGPDRMLYITAGDATDTSNAQNKNSLGGKILRVRPDGTIPTDNPFPSSPVFSYGHRNPQGLAWDSHGTLWASEFGQDTWDELNIVRAGADYGWPIVEGIAHNPAYVDPVYQWRTDDACPSGLAIVRDTIFLAGLGGERLWIIHTTNGGPPVEATAYFQNGYGRLRDVVPAGDDTLWMLTDNTDGRGTPRTGDDRIVAVPLAVAP